MTRPSDLGLRLVLASAVSLAWVCSQSAGGNGGGKGGSTGSGGARGSGGETNPGGAAGSGDASGSGGAVASGGTKVSGGATGSGGATKGGATGPGGTTASGGAPTSGGATASGGAASGGNTGAGGTTSPGTVIGNCPGSCAAPTTLPSCVTPPTPRITQVNIGAVLNYSTDEVYNIPLAIAAKPGGGSLVAWMTGYKHYGSSTASQVQVAELDCDDKLVGTPYTFEGYDFQDLAADGDGGVIVLTRDAQGGPDAQHCGDVNNLCVTPSDRPGCYDMYMVRFDCAGTEQWATKLTSSSASVMPYTSGGGDNLFVWWYQHHGRVAYDGTNYAAYFCDAITVTNNQCANGAGKVDIHEGDRMKVVDPSGKLLTGHDSFDIGCSHSWTARMVWDSRTKHFVTTCATDNNCRIARAPNYQTIASATCDGTLFGGDVINAGNTGYWIAWSYQNAIKLEHFATAASDKTVTTAGNTQNPHLVALGSNAMMLTWKSGSGQAAQIYDATTGAAVGSQFTIAVPDHPWQSWKPFPDGSVAWAGVSAASSTVTIARVPACSN